jgi:hypothetical protein
MNDLINILKKIEDDTIILTFIDYKYIPIFNIFYTYFEKLNLKNLIVIALDLNTYNYLKKYEDLYILYLQYNLNNKELFWKFRLSTINYIFKISMKNIIHTDSDCLWFKNIIEEVKNLDYDIIGSIAYGFPEDLVKKHGFILCCGFYYIKYNDKTKDFFDKIINQQLNSNDDQILMNTYIFNNKKIILNYNNHHFITKYIQTVDNLEIAIIHDTIISRTYQSSLYCFHPYLPSKNINGKLYELYMKLKSKL